MRVLLRAISIAAVVSAANATLACPADTTTHALPEIEVIAPLKDVVLLNHEDEQPLASQPLLTTENAPPAWDEIEFLPSPAVLAGLDVHIRTILVDDEGEPRLDVAYTGSARTETSTAEPAALAMDGYEDR